MEFIKTFESFNEKDCGCNDCGGSNLTKWESETDSISEALTYHIESGNLLTENVFRYGSEEYFNIINEARQQYLSGNLTLSKVDEEIIKTSIGEKVMFEGKEVWLDIPMLNDDYITEKKSKSKDKYKAYKSGEMNKGGKKAYRVYVANCNEKTSTNPRGIKVVEFGSGMRAKINDKDAKKRYNARHGCSKGKHNDRCKPGYWSCRLPRFSEKLGLTGSGTWW